MSPTQPRVVMVTGGAQGIGFGVASCFAERGDILVLADVQETAAGEAAERLGGMGAAGAMGLECDITQRPQVEAAVAAAIERYGRVDVLVNNAGICPFVPIMEMTPETWQKVLDVNLTGAFHCTQVVAKHLIERAEGGRIVFITSLAENLTQPTQVDYGASKAGLRMAMAGFATALGPHGITCNAVAPGMILTPMSQDHWSKPGPAERVKHIIPAGRLGTPRDIGHAVVFLASPEAEYINGITLRVDGGFAVLING